jgi:HSP20 family protein
MHTVTTNEKEASASAQKIEYATPRANITETKDGFVLTAEMPGVRKEKVEISVENDELVVIGRRSEIPQQGEVLYRETRPLDFRRALVLDSSIDATKINARMEQGVLRVHLPKTEAVKPRTIKID